MVTPSVHRKNVHKRDKPFHRHHCDRYKRLPTSWRRPKGIDSAVRRRFRGVTKMAKIGYGTNKKTRHTLPNGFLKFTVHNMAELEVLLMHNRKYAAEIAHNVSQQKRKELIERAQQLNVKVLNGKAKVRQEDDE